jgi:hypothetical protein
LGSIRISNRLPSSLMGSLGIALTLHNPFSVGNCKRLTYQVGIINTPICDAVNSRVTLWEPKAPVLIEAVKAEADRFAANLFPIIGEAQKGDATTLPEIAAALYARGIATARAGQWHAQSIPISWNEHEGLDCDSSGARRGSLLVGRALSFASARAWGLGCARYATFRPLG